MGLARGSNTMFQLTPPTQMTFYISVAAAIVAVVLRVLVYSGVATPFHTGGFLVLLIGYLILIAGNLSKGV
jgi:hypothetical protein